MKTVVIERRKTTSAELHALLDLWLVDGDYNIVVKASVNGASNKSTK